MRIKVLRTPTLADLDGLDLRHFAPGTIYDVGTALGAVMLAEGWAAPVPDDSSAVTPFSDHDPYVTRVMRNNPPNLRREAHPPYLDDVVLAADLERRRRKRRS